jgi:hypothetical protein
MERQPSAQQIQETQRSSKIFSMNVCFATTCHVTGRVRKKACPTIYIQLQGITPFLCNAGWGKGLIVVLNP